ncbi:hypothetical protein D3C86_1255600 [compost metagenome]
MNQGRRTVLIRQHQAVGAGRQSRQIQAAELPRDQGRPARQVARHLLGDRPGRRPGQPRFQRQSPVDIGAYDGPEVEDHAARRQIPAAHIRQFCVGHRDPCGRDRRRGLRRRLGERRLRQQQGGETDTQIEDSNTKHRHHRR